MPPLPPDLGAETTDRNISLLRPLSFSCSEINRIKLDGVLFKTDDKCHYTPQQEVYMHAHDFQDRHDRLFVASQ